ncbi:MAG TPA: EamA family transporter [Syntrophomonadaceae bacterium]|nr:EamA family transporter [Syntrophomonadaceae bacterium]
MKTFIFALIGMLFWGIAPIFGKMGLVQVNPNIALSMRSIVITAILLVWLLATGQAGSLASVTPKAWLFIGLEGVCASLLGHLAYYYAIKFGEVSQISPIMSGFPIVTVMLAALLLGEKFTPAKLIGAILIVLGVLIIKR